MEISSPSLLDEDWLDRRWVGRMWIEKEVRESRLFVIVRRFFNSIVGCKEGVREGGRMHRVGGGQPPPAA